MTSIETVLFVCIHNSARSQMAEAFVNVRYRDRLRAFSAGLEAGTLNPTVVEAMRDVGADISKNRRSPWTMPTSARATTTTTTL
jgi:arsenate reductase